jgi:hypothetical protein
MGKLLFTEKKPFTNDHVKNKDLVIEMLKYEEVYNNGPEGQMLWKTKLNKPSTTLNVIYAIHRVVLNFFDFDTSDESVETYRTIFLSYYNGPHDYDKDVIGAAFYMRNNRCVFYDRPELNLGDKMPDCNILTLNGEPINLLNVLEKHDFQYAFVGGFSNS